MNSIINELLRQKMKWEEYLMGQNNSRNNPFLRARWNPSMKAEDFDESIANIERNIRRIVDEIKLLTTNN